MKAINFELVLCAAQINRKKDDRCRKPNGSQFSFFMLVGLQHIFLTKHPTLDHQMQKGTKRTSVKNSNSQPCKNVRILHFHFGIIYLNNRQKPIFIVAYFNISSASESAAIEACIMGRNSTIQTFTFIFP